MDGCKTHRFIISKLEQFLTAQAFLDRVTHVLSNCHPSKFLLHIICCDIILDCNYLSCQYLVWEFAWYLWTATNKKFLKLLPPTQPLLTVWSSAQLAILHLMMLNKQTNKQGWKGTNNMPIDKAIYTKNCLFCLVGMAKPGKEQLQIHLASSSFLSQPGAPRKVSQVWPGPPSIVQAHRG